MKPLDRNLPRFLWIQLAFLLTTSCIPSVGQDQHAEGSRRRKGKRIPIFYRTDGFSKYYGTKYPLTKEKLQKEMVDPLVQGGVSGIIWGITAGSRVTFDSQTGQLLGDGLTPQMW